MTKKKLAKGIVVTFTVAMLALSFAGCGNSETKNTGGTQTQEATTGSSALADPLSFVKSGEIYFDNQLGVTISVDGKKLDGNTTTYQKGASIAIDGLDPEGSTSYVVAYMKKGNDQDRSGVSVSSGMDNSKVSESLTKLLNMDAEKVCVCLYKPGEKWNQSLSEEMNKLIEGYLPAGMDN